MLIDYCYVIRVIKAMTLSGKTVLITGASRGIGAATARHFATLNANVVGDTTFTSPTTLMTTDLTVDGTVHITGKQTNESTISADGDIDTKAGNSPTLATHTHNYFSGAGGAGSGAPAETKKPS